MTSTLPRRSFLRGFGAVALAGALAACTRGSSDAGDATGVAATSSEVTGASTDAAVAPTEAIPRPAGWTDATHGDAVEPDLATVFPDDRVNRLVLRITPEDWTAMLDDMTALYGARGTGEAGGPGAGGFGGQPGGGQLQPGAAPNGAPQQGGRGGFGATTENPTWVPGIIEFNGLTWTSVGVRFKGNSSLRSAWNAGTDKLPFKFDFDEFEDDVAEIKNQRFYGFKQLSLSNNFNDPTEGIRETLSYELLAAAGLVAANTGRYELILDRGDGETSLGLYTVIEVPDDTVIQRAFGSDDGNIYEAEGNAASLAAGVRDQIETAFEKENNEAEADWSDLEALYDVLHAEQRTTNAAAWRSDLEAIFEVDVFLEWLGLAVVLQHWDTYGSMPHNFYLYHDPATDRLSWISWDHNLVLGAGGGGGGGGGANAGPGGGGLGRAASFDQQDVDASWPLIRYLLDDPVYYDRYLDFLTRTRDEVFLPDRLAPRIEELRALLAPHAGATFDAAVDTLLTTIEARAEALATFLDA